MIKYFRDTVICCQCWGIVYVHALESVGFWSTKSSPCVSNIHNFSAR